MKPPSPQTKSASSPSAGKSNEKRFYHAGRRGLFFCGGVPFPQKGTPPLPLFKTFLEIFVGWRRCKIPPHGKRFITPPAISTYSLFIGATTRRPQHCPRPRPFSLKNSAPVGATIGRRFPSTHRRPENLRPRHPFITKNIPMRFKPHRDILPTLLIGICASYSKRFPLVRDTVCLPDAFPQKRKYLCFYICASYCFTCVPKASAGRWRNPENGARRRTGYGRDRFRR